TFFSLVELNDAIRVELDDLNDRVMRRYGESRRQLFERLERPALQSMPASRFTHGEWIIDAGVNIDYHVDLDRHFYSVHYGLVQERVDARLTATTVEIFHRGARVATHPRSYARGGFTTTDEHMPAAHRKHAKWTPDRMARWAGSVGPLTRALVEAIIAERRHP